MFAPQPDGRAVTLWADLGRIGRRAARLVRATTRPRSSSSTGASAPLAASWPTSATRRRPRSRTPGFGDALLGLRLGPRVPRPRQARRPDDPARARDGGRRLRRGVVRDRRRSARPLAWRGVRYTAMGPVVRGHDRGAARRRRRQRRRGRGRDGLRQGRPVGARRGARGGGAGGRARRSGPARGSRTSSTVDGVATGVVLEGGEEIAAPASSSGIDPKRLLTGARRPGDRSGRRCAGGPATSARPGRWPRSTSSLDGLPDFPAAAGDARLLRGRIQVGTTVDRRRWSGRSTPSKYGRISDSPVLEATIPSLVDPSLVAGAAGRHAGHERPHPVDAAEAAPAGDWADAARRARRPRDPRRSRRWRPGSARA